MVILLIFSSAPGTVQKAWRQRGARVNGFEYPDRRVFDPLFPQKSFSEATLDISYSFQNTTSVDMKKCGG